MDYRHDVAPKLLQLFLEDSRGINLVRHHIESYDDFVASRIPQIVSAFNSTEINIDYAEHLQSHRHKLSISFDNVRLSRPAIVEKDGTRSVITPQEARLRSLSYCAQLYADMHITGYSADQPDARPETKVLQNVCIGKIPIMVRSRYCILQNMPVLSIGDCRYDQGGYFIISGAEKCVIAHDRMTENQTFVFENVKTNMTYSHVAEVRSVGWPTDGGAGTVKSLVLRISARPNQFGHYIRVALPHSKQDVPVIVLFRALGLDSDKKILKDVIAIGLQPDENNMIMEFMTGSIAEASHVRATNDALDIVGRHIHTESLLTDESRLESIRNVIIRDILPHTGQDFKAKAMYLGYMVRRLVRCKLGIDECDDRDSYINKRVDATGSLMASLFRVHYSRMIKDMRNSLAKEILSGVWRSSGSLVSVLNAVNVAKHVKSTFIESGMKYALATGNWNVKGSMSQSKTSRKQGVAQVLNRLTYVATLSHLRRVVTPMEKNGKMVQPRKLHNTQWGIMCPSECFDPETPILMWDGTIKAAKHIVVGDYLIDDVGNPVRVKSTCSGFKTMYEIVPDKKNFMRHTVTDNHILTLKVKKDFGDDNVIDITIEQFLSLSPSVQKNLFLFKSSGIHWDRQYVTVDPYMMGMCLGDLNKKSIPKEYIVNDKETRLALLAGLVDTIGNLHGNEIRISGDLIHDIQFLASSLGFSCHVHEGQLSITGANLHEIPLKKMTVKDGDDFLIESSFELVKKDLRSFVGWQLEGNGRFLLGDMTISHNTPEVRFHSLCFY